FRGPAFRVDDPSMAALDMLYDLWFGETSDLYRELVEVDQVVDRLYPWVLPTEDPSLATVLARVKDYANLLPVRDRILSILARARSEEVPTDRLRDAQAYARYSLLRSFDNSEAIASNLARFVRFDRSTRALEALFEQYEALTPKALLEAGQRFIRDDALVLTTLSEEPQPAEEEGPPSLKTLFTKPALLDESSMVVASSPTPQLLMKVQFLVGSADDPEGKEGLAAMAAMMIAEGGSIEMRADKITKALLPMAGSHSAQVDLEMTTFTWIVHADNFDRFAEIVLGQLLSPGYRGDDFDRIKDQQRNALVQDLRSNNDEEFGKEVLQSIVFAGTPYGHPTLGTGSGINSIALADIREFVEANFTQARLVLGLSGSFPDGAVDRLRAELARLPGGDSPSPVTAPVGAQPAALEVEIVEKDTRSVAFSFGHPIDVLRDHPDFPALWLARATLGDHRAFGGRLFLRIREVRGINYGDYAYIEAFPGGMYRFFPQPNRARRAQLFEVWIRPVQPEQAVFALKLALHEVEKFIEGGLDDDEFERVHGYLLKNIYVMLQSQDAQLGYDLDGRWFGTGEFTAWMRKSLEGLTRKRVNEAIRRHLSAERLTVAVITGDAKGLKEQLLDSADAVMNYDAPRDESLLAEDKIVGARPLGLTPERIRIRS
ncbi:MAG: insulinase family protein, partial [Dehalococcoidia bacterium]|nr:insulinase family protein [Dehalococcoidia bacterium]